MRINIIRYKLRKYLNFRANNGYFLIGIDWWYGRFRANYRLPSMPILPNWAIPSMSRPLHLWVSSWNQRSHGRIYDFPGQGPGAPCASACFSSACSLCWTPGVLYSWRGIGKYSVQWCCSYCGVRSHRTWNGGSSQIEKSKITYRYSTVMLDFDHKVRILLFFQPWIYKNGNWIWLPNVELIWFLIQVNVKCKTKLTSWRMVMDVTSTLKLQGTQLLCHKVVSIPSKKK